MIVAHYIDYKDSTEIFSSVNLQGAVLGMYDVIVQNPDFQSSKFQNGFEVQTGSIGWEGFAQPGCLSGNFDPGQLLELELQLPENVRVNRVFPVILRYHNIGNIDIPLPTRVLTCELQLGYIGITPQSAVEDSLQYLTLELREDGGPDNILRAGASGEITVYAISKKELTNVVPTHMIMFKLLE